MRLFIMGLLMIAASTLSPGDSAAQLGAVQTADVEGHVFNKRTGVPLAGAGVVIYEVFTAGPVPLLLGEDTTDANGFYEVRIPAPTFPFGVIEVYCRTRRGIVVLGKSSAPLQADVIRRRDIYLNLPRRVRKCQDLKPGDLPLFIRN